MIVTLHLDFHAGSGWARNVKELEERASEKCFD